MNHCISLYIIIYHYILTNDIHFTIFISNTQSSVDSGGVQGCGTHASFGSGGVLGQETNAAGTCGATQPLSHSTLNIF